MTTPKLRAARSIQIRHLLANIDQQLADAEAVLLTPLPPDELRKVIDRIANLKVARKNLQIVLDADAETRPACCAKRAANCESGRVG